jgi:fido (protein-threonine AMPylation protein)
VYQRLTVQISELWQRMGGLPNPQEAADIWRGIWFEEAHHSTALEGNTLVLKQVEQLLAEGLAVGNKELSEYLEVRGYGDAAEWVYGQAIDPQYELSEPLTLTEVREVHRLAMQPVWDVSPHPSATDREGPGEFRRHDIHPFPGGMTPPSWVQVAGEMRSWLTAIGELKPGTSEFPEHVAALHCRFEQIHPFIDGNGRTGRLLLNLILVRYGYPPAIIYKKQRPRYLWALRRGDVGDFGELGELLARAVLDNLYRFVVPAVAGPARLVPLAALQTDGMTTGALRAAAVRGALQASKGADGQWRSSRNWVDEYVAARDQQRGRPRGHPS